MEQHRTLAYRPYLDGLRAVAVLLVFVFHAAPTALPGGFIGVDVFFVLSGYLITSILVSQLEQDRPQLLADFYVRRIRRLMPAALLLLVVITMREAVWGNVLELGVRLREVRATLFYVANWNLIDQSDDYFAEGISGSPLRHMWSLAIEEQFYVVWPLVVVGLYRIGARKRWFAFTTTALLIASAAIMVVLYDPTNVSRAYYGTDSRVFQPLVGALLAIVVPPGRLAATESTARIGRVSALAAAGSLGALLVVSATVAGDDAVYYRVGALAVAVVTALLILALETTGTNPVRAVLGLKPFVWLGQISYGFYLWHWPVIVWIQPPDGAGFVDRRIVNVVQLGLSVALALASYILVERPVRSGLRLPRWSSFATALAAIVGLAVVAGGVLATPGESVAAQAIKDRSYEPCPDNPQPCVKVEAAGDDAPTVVLVGDSTAQAYDPALKVLANQHGFRYVQAAVGGCSIGHRLLATGNDGEVHKPSNLMCYDEMPGIYERVLDEWEPDLILATSWNEPSRHIWDGETVQSSTPDHVAQTRQALTEAVDTLTSEGADLVFIDILPPGPSVDCLESADDGTSGDCVRTVSEPRREAPYNALFAELAAARPDVLGVIDVTDDICPDAACPLTVDGVVVRYDGGHFTGTMSELLAPELDRQLEALGVDLSRRF